MDESARPDPAALTLADLPLRADLRGTEPYGAPQLPVAVALNTNENPYPPSPRLAEALGRNVADVAAGLNRYPDRDATRLRADLARYLGHGLDTASVWAANGSNEVLQQLLQAFGGPGRRALGFEPSYSMYPVISRVTATEWVGAERGPDFGLTPEAAAAAVERHRPDIVFLTSPNNPTGTALPLEVIAAVAETAPGMVVVDEAYAEFRREDTPSALSLLADHPRLVVTRTMSKAFALAGARVGYLAAHPAVVDALQLVRLPYHLSSVTQVVAGTALEFGDELLGQVKQLREERDALVAWLRGQGYTVADSDANFVLFGDFPDRSAAWRGLLEHGVLVREVGPPGKLRVTVGTPEEMSAFRTALLQVRAEHR
ncbi:histidinol-phosphate transaminase [Streptomonospora nanhaiensis]|uniref:Histidinol-phosphate aminotransferase n=1 Tax=Streptomonospora nanhaiensis TaxID=1323731 RepID=A0A853BHM3_9ACTN|nr:histidinol-phosphate transaminase [Streptomonospora nanhaiensis]MBV2362535.1 histidinol-phosphate transaminase [Streptomonospora nanhaiensis]MBX9391174.1 histidinol-phosphate transaminase [Streptomonospora nanhaiensis]NYI94803.1 histidinol-phosphate aminotransferase [Streptomonospora nanhaiensis]